MTIREFQNQFGIIGNSKEIKEVIGIIMQVAKSDISVLLYGESGTGKEVFAKAIHGYSNRNNGQLVSVNCGAIPENLLESELFGHVKGSYTGAIDSRKGYFEMADEGSLFLDEIGEMPLQTQVKLLRALETREFLRVGAETVTKVDIRLIAATNRDLQKEVELKKFRKDLYYRLKAVTVTIPPLRERRSDIEDLIFHFMGNYAEKNDLPEFEITREALDFLTHYSWPGNVRELKSVIETACALSKNHILDVDYFEKELSVAHNEPDYTKNLPALLTNFQAEDVEKMFVKAALIEIKKDLLELKQMMYYNHSNTHSEVKDGFEINHGSNQEIIPLHILEKQAIENALRITKWNKRKTAKLLQINERTLFRKINEYGLK